MTLDDSMSRPLRRSKTISVTDYQTAVRNSELDETENKENVDDNKMKTRTPGPSCQALRHAVSSLTRLDDFNMEKLGIGFFAEVFKVTHKTTGQVMVLKMNSNYCNRLSMLREVQLMNRLAHPNILRFLGVCVHEGQLHALTEYMNKGGLNEVLADTNIEMPWTLKIKISLDIASGMKYLHSRGVFHRDLTSRNVLVNEEPQGHYHAVVADFGLAAKIPDPLNKEDKLPVVGSPYWIAPEVLHNKWYDEKADVFSYGIILCEITARIDADPEILPRTQNFGLDYVAFSEKVDYCPLEFLRLAYTCCQMDPLKRPNFSEIYNSLEQIQKNIENDNIDVDCRNGSIKRSGHKRSRSEDNILQITEDIEEHPQNYASPLTPQILGETMSKDDPFYTPCLSNPFEGFQRFMGRKILGTPRGKDSYGFDLPSPSNPFTPPCTPRTPENNTGRKKHFYSPQSQSLPSSPVLLRKAAERLHQESIHGSNFRRHSVNPNKFNLCAFGTRSKSTVFPEALAYRLQYELSESAEKRYQHDSSGDFEEEMKQQVNNENEKSSNKPRRKLYTQRQLSADAPSSYIGMNGACNKETNNDDTCHLNVNWNTGIMHVSHDMRDYVSSISSTESFMSVDENTATPVSPMSDVSSHDLFQHGTEHHGREAVMSPVQDSDRKKDIKVLLETSL